MTNTRFTESRNKREGWYWGYGIYAKGRFIRIRLKGLSLRYANYKWPRKDQP